MATLDRVIQMQQQGYSNDEIVQVLRNEGIAPTEIYDALNQASVKSAIAGESTTPEIPAAAEPQAEQAQAPAPMPETQSPAPEPLPQEQYPTEQQNLNPQDYANQDLQANEGYQDTEQQIAAPESVPAQEPASAQDYYAQTPNAYADAGYSDYDPYSAPAYDTETISEIASQIVSEKIKDIQEESKNFKSFQLSAEEKIKNIDSRLKKIEDKIDHLNRAVIGKIADFGQSSSMIQKDLSALHDTVSKLMNPLIDTYNELKEKKHGHTSAHKKASANKSKKTAKKTKK